MSRVHQAYSCAQPLLYVSDFISRAKAAGQLSFNKTLNPVTFELILPTCILPWGNLILTTLLIQPLSNTTYTYRTFEIFQPRFNVRISPSESFPSFLVYLDDTVVTLSTTRGLRLPVVDSALCGQVLGPSRPVAQTRRVAELRGNRRGQHSTTLAAALLQRKLK